jgi:hypothetical protein
LTSKQVSPVTRLIPGKAYSICGTKRKFGYVLWITTFTDTTPVTVVFRHSVLRLERCPVPRADPKERRSVLAISKSKAVAAEILLITVNAMQALLLTAAEE